VKRGEELSRVPLHSVRTLNLHTKPGGGAYGEILILYGGGY
jgi:hypothetical protein